MNKEQKPKCISEFVVTDNPSELPPVDFHRTVFSTEQWQKLCELIKLSSTPKSGIFPSKDMTIMNLSGLEDEVILNKEQQQKFYEMIKDKKK